MLFGAEETSLLFTEVVDFGTWAGVGGKRGSCGSKMFAESSRDEDPPITTTAEELLEVDVVVIAGFCFIDD
jgi:hypothetical protein